MACPQPSRFGTVWEIGHKQLCGVGQAGPGQVTQPLHFGTEDPSVDCDVPTPPGNALMCELSVDMRAKAWVPALPAA